MDARQEEATPAPKKHHGRVWPWVLGAVAVAVLGIVITILVLVARKAGPVPPDCRKKDDASNFLQRIFGNTGGDPACACPENMERDGQGRCICPTATHELFGDVCLPQCAAGTRRRDDGVCECVCPEGFLPVGGRCLERCGATTCDEGTRCRDERCLPACNGGMPCAPTERCVPLVGCVPDELNAPALREQMAVWLEREGPRPWEVRDVVAEYSLVQFDANSSVVGPHVGHVLVVPADEGGACPGSQVHNWMHAEFQIPNRAPGGATKDACPQLATTSTLAADLAAFLQNHEGPGPWQIRSMTLPYLVVAAMTRGAADGGQWIRRHMLVSLSPTARPLSVVGWGGPFLPPHSATAAAAAVARRRTRQRAQQRRQVQQQRRR